MQPYQRATEEILRGKREAPQIAAGLSGLALKGGALTGALNSLLRPGVAANLAIDTLSKLNPYIKKFVSRAQENGYSEEDVVDHMRETMAPQEEAGEERSYFEEMTNGADLSKLPDPVKKQLSFLAMIATQLQQNKVGKGDAQYQKLKSKVRDLLSGKSNTMLEEATRFDGQEQQMQAQQPMQGQQSGQGQQALMAILQKIQASRGQ